MPPQIIGPDQQNYQPEGYTVHQAPDGSGNATLVYKCRQSSGYFGIPTPLQEHPDYPSLLLYESEISLENGAIGNVKAIYYGVLADDPSSLSQYEFNVTAVAQPIETNPLFSQPTSSPPVTTTDLAAIQQALDTNTAPIGLSTSAGTTLYNLKLRGVDSFYGPSAQFKVNYCDTDPPDDYSLVGYIAESVPFPSGFSPTVGTYQNWLFIGYSWRKAAGVVTITEEYQLSGPAGWDPVVYTAP